MLKKADHQLDKQKSLVTVISNTKIEADLPLDKMKVVVTPTQSLRKLNLPEVDLLLEEKLSLIR